MGSLKFFIMKKFQTYTKVERTVEPLCTHHPASRIISVLLMFSFISFPFLSEKMDLDKILTH